MCDKNYGPYNSDSDFSDLDDNECAPAQPKKQAPTLMDILCSDGNNPEHVLSPRHSGSFLSFSEATTSSPAFSDHDQKTGLFEAKVLQTEGEPQVRFFEPKLEEPKKKEPVLRLIPVSQLQSENMRLFRPQANPIVSSFERP